MSSQLISLQPRLIVGALGLLSLEATAASNEGNVAGAPVGLGFLGSWRLAF